MVRNLLALLLIFSFSLATFSPALAGDGTVNRHVFTGKEYDENTGLIYFGARYYDPDTGRFITQDNFQGDAANPPSLNKYLYAYSNPTVFFDLFGYESVSTMIDNAAEGCNGAGCYSWAFLKTVYSAGSLGFASVHDPQRDAYDAGKISGAAYTIKGIGGGGALVAANVVTGRMAGAAMVGESLLTQSVIGASTGAGLGALNDAAAQVSNIDAGAQQSYNYKQTAVSTVLGGGLGAAVPAAGVAAEALGERISQSRIAAPVPTGNRSGITMEDPSGSSAFLVADNSSDVAAVRMPKTSSMVASQNLPGPTLSQRVADTFTEGRYVNRQLQTNETFYKYHGVDHRTGRKVSWFTNNKYASEDVLRSDLAIRKDWGVNIESVSEFDVPRGTWVSEGAAAAQGADYPGGGYQAVIQNVPRTWVQKTTKAFP